MPVYGSISTTSNCSTPSKPINEDNCQEKLSVLRESLVDSDTPELTLMAISNTIAEKGMYPGVYPIPKGKTEQCDYAVNDIAERQSIHHSKAEKAILNYCLQHKNDYTDSIPCVSISPSRYNPEKKDEQIANDIIAGLKDDALINIKREIVALERKVPEDKKRDIQDSDINLITHKHLNDYFRDQLRRARQGVARGVMAPDRTTRDGWPMANVRYGFDSQLTDSSVETMTRVTHDSNKTKYEWGMSIPDFANRAKLFDVTLRGKDSCEQVVTVYLDEEEMAKKLCAHDGIYPHCNNDIFVNPEPAGEVILHAFNTRYCDITLRAEEISRSGFSYVMISPPLTWRDDGPYTPDYEKGNWYHVYQPEDHRVIDNPHGNLQSLTEMINVLRGYGISVIADVPFNFMGTGGDGGSGGEVGKGTLIYPSTDIREARIMKERKYPGLIESQMIVKSIKGQVQFPEYPYTSFYDFEQGTDAVKDWNDTYEIQHKRLGTLPKVKGDKEWVHDIQKSVLEQYIKIGIKGVRIDADKHLTDEQRDSVFTKETTPTLAFGETITRGSGNPDWDNILGPRLDKNKNIGAYDFPLLNKLNEAFSISGSLKSLKILPGYSPSLIRSEQSVTFAVNHDLPNNGDIFECFLFKHPVDELLANAYIMSIPCARPMIFMDGQAQKSKTEITRGDKTPPIGGKAWTNVLESEVMRNIISFNNIFQKMRGIWFASEGSISTDTCIAFSRGTESAKHYEHTGIVIINKSNEGISDVTWPNSLKPGIYVDLGTAATGTYEVGSDGKFTKSLTIPARAALMLAHTRIAVS